MTVTSYCLLHTCHWENISQLLKTLGTGTNLGKAFKSNCCSCLFQQFLCTPGIWRFYVLLMLLVTFCVSFFYRGKCICLPLFPGMNGSSIWSGHSTPICSHILLLQKHKHSGLFFFHMTQCVSVKSLFIQSQRLFRPHLLSI